ncbi:MAG: helix-turn-helix domain-containing protein [Acidimicrobiales bacterium]
MEQSISGIGVLDKAMTVLAAVEDRPRSLAELVERSGMSRSTTHRLALALESHGLLGRDGDGRFHLGAGLGGLGKAAADALPLAELAGPVLADLRDGSGESAQLYVRQGDHRVCVAALDSPHELRTIVEPGATLPIGVGSGGRLLAGEAPGRAGWTESVEDRAPGVASVSAPVHDRSGALVAAISVSGPIDRIGRTPGKRHGAAVVAAAAALEALL